MLSRGNEQDLITIARYARNDSTLLSLIILSTLRKLNGMLLQIAGSVVVLLVRL